MSGEPIEIVRVTTVALAYHVLAHLDLGRDAASLFDPRLPERPWREPLHRAYLDAPGRLTVHALPLTDPEGLDDVLRRTPPASLADGPGRTLAKWFADAMQAQHSRFEATLEMTAELDRARRREVRDRIASDLHSLRAALWERQGPAPPLRIYDCPSLGPAGRAASTREGRAVAVSLAEPIGHVLCQIIHEEIHAVTDPVVRASAGPQPRDTRVGAPGHEVHEALEHAAIEVGEALIAARAPRWSQAYRRWRARFGV
jgi:hypothetical protein